MPTWKQLRKFIPVCFVVGAATETILIRVGFYTRATRKQAEERLQIWIDEEDRRRIKLEAAEKAENPYRAEGGDFGVDSSY